MLACVWCSMCVCVFVCLCVGHVLAHVWCQLAKIFSYKLATTYQLTLAKILCDDGTIGINLLRVKS